MMVSRVCPHQTLTSSNAGMAGPGAVSGVTMVWDVTGRSWSGRGGGVIPVSQRKHTHSRNTAQGTPVSRPGSLTAPGAQDRASPPPTHPGLSLA